MLAAACVMIPTVWLPDVKTLSYLGFAGVAGTLSVAATVRNLILGRHCTPWRRLLSHLDGPWLCRWRALSGCYSELVGLKCVPSTMVVAHMPSVNPHQCGCLPMQD